MTHIYQVKMKEEKILRCVGNIAAYYLVSATPASATPAGHAPL